MPNTPRNPNRRPPVRRSPDEPRSNAPFEIEITTMGHHNVGIGRYKSRAVLVPYTIPGERLRVQPNRIENNVIHADGVQMLDASADRVYPRCPHFGPHRCGRCHWQHIDYAAQLLLKQDVLADQLERGGVSDAPIRPVIASPIQWGYHWHMTLTTANADGTPHTAPPIADPVADEDEASAHAADASGGTSESEQTAESPDAPPEELVPPLADEAKDHALTLAFPSSDETRFIPIEECHILHPDLLDLYQQLDIDLTGLRRVRLQRGSDGENMLILTALTDSAPALETDLPISINLILPDNEPLNLIGESHSRFTFSERTFRATAGSFFRPNLAQMPTLIDTVINLLDVQPDEHALDLYAGVGVFTAFIAPLARLVSLIESYPPAVTDAEVNLEAVDNVDIYEGGVEGVLEAMIEEEATADCAIVDPPNGVSADVIRMIAALGVRRIVHLSDDPALLARDIKRYASAGYTLDIVQPIDLAPQTYFIDTVSRFTRI